MTTSPIWSPDGKGTPVQSSSNKHSFPLQSIQKICENSTCWRSRTWKQGDNHLGQWHLIRVQLLLLDFLMAEAKVNTTTLHADPHNSAILKTLRVNCQGPDFVFQTWARLQCIAATADANGAFMSHNLDSILAIIKLSPFHGVKWTWIYYIYIYINQYIISYYINIT